LGYGNGIALERCVGVVNYFLVVQSRYSGAFGCKVIPEKINTKPTIAVQQLHLSSHTKVYIVNSFAM
jgi:hypothetical protein